MRDLRHTALLIGAFVGACSGSKADAPPASSSYLVSGTVVVGGSPVADVGVRIDGAINWSATTDAVGYFAIPGVTLGMHTIDVSQTNDDGSFSELQSPLEVASDTTLQSLQLPKAVTLAAPTEVQSSQMRLSWAQTDAADFREYKLYRTDSPGIDEVSGQLVYVSTARTDTSFLDTQLLAGKTYYYRVYVLNDLGRLGGSNVAHGQALVANLVPSGDFEDAAALTQWEIMPFDATSTVTRDGAVAHAGGASLHCHGTSPIMLHLIPLIPLQKNVVYQLSLFLKISGARNNTNDTWLGVMQGPTIVRSWTFDRSTDWSIMDGDFDWAMHAQTFSVTDDTPITLEMTCDAADVWIDDLSITPP